MPAFTKRFDGKTLSLTAPIAVRSRQSRGENRFFATTALWDTGSEISCVSEEIVRRFELIPINQLRLVGVTGEKTTNVYQVLLRFPNGPVIALDVLGVNLVHDPGTPFQVLLGMDVITQTDFALTNPNGRTTLSIRFPAAEEIDFDAPTS